MDASGSPYRAAYCGTAEERALAAEALAAAQAAESQHRARLARAELLSAQECEQRASAAEARAREALAEAEANDLRGRSLRAGAAQEDVHARSLWGTATALASESAGHTAAGQVLLREGTEADCAAGVETTHADAAALRAAVSPTTEGSHVERCEAALAHGRAATAATDAQLCRLGAERAVMQAACTRDKALRAETASRTSTQLALDFTTDAVRMELAADKLRAQSVEETRVAAAAKRSALLSHANAEAAEREAVDTAAAAAQAAELAAICRQQADLDAQLAATYESSVHRRVVRRSASPARPGCSSPYTYRE